MSEVSRKSKLHFRLQTSDFRLHTYAFLTWSGEFACHHSCARSFVHGSALGTRASWASSSRADETRLAGSFSRHAIRIDSSCLGIGSSDTCEGGTGLVCA